MGIVDRSSISSLDRGKPVELGSLLTEAERLAQAGADILDIGWEPSGPPHERSAQEEVDHLAPAVAAVVARTGLAVSVDTQRASVAQACFAAGAVLGNDLSGFADPEYLTVAASCGASVVATHNPLRRRILEADPANADQDVVTAVETFLLDRLERAFESGLAADRMLFDLGLGLGKTTVQSLELLGATGTFASLGPPILLSLSNKDFLGELLGRPVGHRRDAAIATVALAVALGARVVRVHDPEAARRVCRTIEAVLAG
jgi:dihydropteroate synthase